MDAIGGNIHEVKEKYQSIIDENEMTVVYVIITDGYENASRFFSYHDISRKISELEETNKWTFTFLGADFDAFQTSKMLNIKQENVMNFQKSSYNVMSDKINDQMHNYSVKKEKGVFTANFFE